MNGFRLIPSENGIEIYSGERFATLSLTVRTEGGTASLKNARPVGMNRFILSDGDVRAEVRFIADASLVCYAEVRSEKSAVSAEASFDAVFDFAKPDAPAVTVNMKGERFWQQPAWTTASRMTNRTQAAFIKTDGVYCLLPIQSPSLTAYAEGLAVTYSSGESGRHEIGGALFSLSVGNTARATAKSAFIGARDAGAITVPLRDGRKYPEIFEYFGWCTWNAFYDKVSEELILKKLDEFKTAGFVPGWVLIDDGWSETKDKKLVSFEADRAKFPEGLAETVKKIKSYGVKFVGVWHAYTGYWHGIHPESPLAKKYASSLVSADEGMLLPKPDEADVYRFFSAWHRELKHAGIDFVKIDNQSDYAFRVAEYSSGTKAEIASHTAIDRSVEENFGGALINCMGMNTADGFARPSTGVNRNSFDFTPCGPFTFENHAVQNSYNAVINGALYYADYDMFESVHQDAKRAAALRFLSGGPIYTADGIGKSDFALLRTLVGDDDRIKRMDKPAIPTEDEFFTATNDLTEPYKIYTEKEGRIYVGAFGFGGIPSGGGFGLADVCASGTYEFTDTASGRKTTVSGNERVTYTLADGEFAVFVGEKKGS